MEATAAALQPILVLLASAVFAVVLCRTLALPPIVGYLATGLLLGPHALARLIDAEGLSYIALDLDPEREAALAGDTVVFAD